MAIKYFISTRSQTNGTHIVHKDGCPLLPGTGKRLSLGIFKTHGEAVTEGRKYFPELCCCPFCLKDRLEKNICKLSGFHTDINFITFDHMTEQPWNAFLLSMN